MFIVLTWSFADVCREAKCLSYQRGLLADEVEQGDTLPSHFNSHTVKKKKKKSFSWSSGAIYFTFLCLFLDDFAFYSGFQE